MDPKEYIEQLDQQFNYLVEFARQVNELDLAASIFQEPRGMQGAGWSTAITAYEVFEELSAFGNRNHELKREEFRNLLSLYAQLSEAGGVYEGLRNLIGVIELQPFRGWPFNNLVRVRENPRRIIGPNANAIFKELAQKATDIGMLRFAELLEIAFRDDLRNGISHADYIIWQDGVRLRKRNGGNPYNVTFEEINDAINYGAGFFQTLQYYNDNIVRSFSPGRDILGKFSANPPMTHHVEYDEESGSLSISSSSPGGESSPAYERQQRINEKLGGKVLALYTLDLNDDLLAISEHIKSMGFEPQTIVVPKAEVDAFFQEIEENDLWDPRIEKRNQSIALFASPWGLSWLSDSTDFDELISLLERTD